MWRIMVSKCRDENIFASVAAMAGVEFPGYVLCMFIMEGWGRRPVLSLCQVNLNIFCRVSSGNSVSVSAGNFLEIFCFYSTVKGARNPFSGWFTRKCFRRKNFKIIQPMTWLWMKNLLYINIINNILFLWILSLNGP